MYLYEESTYIYTYILDSTEADPRTLRLESIVKNLF